jgi:uncharacterized membrane protein
VAIAITLLVLPLVDLTRDLADGGSVAHLLRDNQAPIWAFLLSFVVIADLWLAQHRLLRHVVAADAWLTRLLLLWTLTIVVLPFPTALVSGPAGAGEQAITKVLYVGTMTVSALVLSLVCREVALHDELRDGSEPPDLAGTFATFVAFVLALALMLAVPATSYWPLLLLALQGRVLVWWRRGTTRSPSARDESSGSTGVR